MFLLRLSVGLLPLSGMAFNALPGQRHAVVLEKGAIVGAIEALHEVEQPIGGFLRRDDRLPPAAHEPE